MKDDFEEGVENKKNQTENETIKMNRKTNCLNKTLKRTEIDPKLKTDSKPKPTYQFRFGTVFLNFRSEPIQNLKFISKPN